MHPRPNLNYTKFVASPRPLPPCTLHLAPCTLHLPPRTHTLPLVLCSCLPVPEQFGTKREFGDPDHGRESPRLYPHL